MRPASDGPNKKDDAFLIKFDVDQVNICLNSIKMTAEVGFSKIIMQDWRIPTIYYKGTE